MQDGSLDPLANLTQLTQLFLSHCSSLTQLPEALSNINKMRKITLLDCPSLMKALPEGLGRLSQFSNLEVRRCNSLRELPESLSELQTLRYLRCERCIRFQTLPAGISAVSSLKELSIAGCNAVAVLPEGIFCGLGSLLWLILEGCFSLRPLPEGVGGLWSLREMNIRGCISLESLPAGLSALSRLRTLLARGCTDLKVSTYFASGRGTAVLGWCSQISNLGRFDRENDLTCGIDVDLFFVRSELTLYAHLSCDIIGSQFCILGNLLGQLCELLQKRNRAIPCSPFPQLRFTKDEFWISCWRQTLLCSQEPEEDVDWIVAL